MTTGSAVCGSKNARYGLPGNCIFAYSDRGRRLFTGHRQNHCAVPQKPGLPAFLPDHDGKVILQVCLYELHVFDPFGVFFEQFRHFVRAGIKIPVLPVRGVFMQKVEYDMLPRKVQEQPDSPFQEIDVVPEIQVEDPEV